MKPILSCTFDSKTWHPKHSVLLTGKEEGPDRDTKSGRDHAREDRPEPVGTMSSDVCIGVGRVDIQDVVGHDIADGKGERERRDGDSAHDHRRWVGRSWSADGLDGGSGPLEIEWKV